MNDKAAELCRAAQNGDAAAASELLTMFYEKVFAYFRRACGDQHEAADLTQKTFSKVWSSLRSYRGRSSVSTWLHSIARHVYVDWRRARKPATERDDKWWQAQPDSNPNPFESAVEMELLDQVYGLVEKLDEDAREVVHLHYYQGLTLEETAEALSVALSTVKYRLRRALDFARRHVCEPKKI